MLPQYPSETDEHVDASAVTGEPQTEVAVSEVNFAQEVREERLAILWKVTLTGVVAFLWILIVVATSRETNVLGALLTLGFTIVGCVSSGHLLRRGMFTPAVWAYALGLMLTVGAAIAVGGDAAAKYAPFGLPILLFMVGLLLPVRDTLILAGLAILSALLIPSAVEGEMTLSENSIVGIAMAIIATALSAQVSGELYAIAEWALENYRKERQTTFALFESRQALEKSFHRQRALAEQLQETNAELEYARHAAEEAKMFRGQFLANMSHELRTPLNAIIGFSQTILDFPAMYDGVELPPQYRQDMNQILSSGKHLLTIINDILDLSKVDAGKLDLEIQPVDLLPVVKGVVATAVGLVGDKGGTVELKQDLPDPLPMVLGDPLRVRQVLLNLYSNAAKFTDVGHIRLIIQEDGDRVVFGVEDTGIGISDADKASIFEEFRQGTAGRKKGRKGAGLGLAISQQLLRLMNGQIWFESVLGRGSTFYIALPKYVPQADELADETTGVVANMAR